MDFVKVEGLGNDFLVFDGPFDPRPEDVRQWCDRRHGVGADGVLVIEATSDLSMSMRYWNADGGEAEMCGNGLRGVARLAYDRGWMSASQFVVSTKAGDHPVTVLDETVVAFVGVPKLSRTESLRVAGESVYPFSIGNPHAVLFVGDVEEAPVQELGSKIEKDPLFPNRTNVEFVEVGDEGSVRARIWERGVGETPASGTGATAAAYVAHAIKDVPAPVSVQLPGGTLVISFNEEGAWMEGPANVVFRGSLPDVSRDV